MKTIVTKTCSLNSATEKLLNQQIGREGMASAYYLAMASWCDKRGYDHAAELLYQHAEEERTHMLKLVHYINDAGGHALHPDITGIPHEFKSFRAIFELILEHELKVTQAINDLVAHCLEIKDFATCNFLQWYVAEQREEEILARRVLELFDIIGEAGVGIYMLDQEIGKLQTKA